MNTWTLRTSLFLTPALAFGVGCATIKKPDLSGIKKVAIVSVTAPQKVPHKAGKGQVGGWDEANRNAIGDQALAAHTDEFSKIGWSVMPAAQLSALPVYKENFEPRYSKASNSVAKALNTLSAMDAQHLYFSPTGLFPIAWEEGPAKDELRLDILNLSIEKPKDLKTKMQEVATKAGVDAAILIHADYCYDDGNFWVGHAGSGTGTAVMTGAFAIYAVTPKGEEIIKTKRIPTPCGGDRRVASDTSTAMVSGHLLYKDERIRKMFQEVAQKAAAENTKLIRNLMKK